MKILIAPNAFKGSLDAFAAAKAIAEGFERSKLEVVPMILPIADGGDGTMEVLVKYFEGEILSEQVYDPLGREIIASYGLINDGRTAIVEMASASGIKHLMPAELNPWIATSYGTGQLIKSALEYNVNEVVITLGGSATVDGGLGILKALGLRVTNAEGRMVEEGGQGLQQAKYIENTELKFQIENVRFTLLCDVENPLLGGTGAAAIFGPQKGADSAMVSSLEKGLSQFAELSEAYLSRDIIKLRHGGAAGGAGAFLSAFLDAEILDGASYLLEQMGFDEKMEQCQLLITSEGRIDEQTRYGKGPYSVALRAREMGKAVIALSGQIQSTLEIDEYQAFDAVLPIGSGPMSLDEAMADTKTNLVRTAQQLGNLLALTFPK